MEPDQNQPQNTPQSAPAPAQQFSPMPTQTPVGPPVSTANPTQLAPKKSAALSITALVLAILGFVTGFIGIGLVLALISIIIATVALVKRSGGKVMSIISISLSAVTLIFGGIFFLISIVAYGNIQDRAKDNVNATSAATVVKYAEAYNADKSTYPSLSQLTSNTDYVRLPSDIAAKVHEGGTTTVDESGPIAYEGCSSGVYVHYFTSSTSAPKTLEAGNPADC